MGTYSVQEHMDLFGGLPERGEAYVDLDMARDVAEPVIIDETNNAAVAVGASMARAVIAAQLYAQDGTLPS